MFRDRLFWVNFPIVPLRPRIRTQLTLQDFLKSHRTANTEIMPTFTTNVSSQRGGNEQNTLLSGKPQDLTFNNVFSFCPLTGPEKLPPVIYEGEEEFVAINEQELLFGFPEHFTDCDNLSVTDRRVLLGRA